MSNPVEFALALGNSHPSGTGSITYEGKFHIVVQNIAFEKQVSIWAQAGAVWKWKLPDLSCVFPMKNGNPVFAQFA